jgi:mannosyltransferase
MIRVMATQASPGRPASPDAPVARGPGALSPTVIIVALTVVAAALRFGTLDVQSIWLDESSTILLVKRGFFGMLRHLGTEETPPLYYVLVWVWTKVTGLGTFGFRSFSALLGTATVPLIYVTGRRLSTRVGLWAAALATFNPALYYYSQEARCYALLVFFAAAAMFFWLRAFEDGDRRSLWMWSLMSALALLTHYYAVFIFIPQTLLLWRRHGLRPLLAPASGFVLTGIALIPLAAWQSSTYAKTLEPSSVPSRAAGAVKQFLVGLYSPLEIVSAVAVGVLVLGALIRLRDDEAKRRVAIPIAAMAVVAFLLPLILPITGIAGYSYEGRHLIAGWLPFALVVALGLDVSRRRLAASALGVGLCAISLAVVLAVNLSPAYQRDNWRDAARTVASVGTPAIVVIPERGFQPLHVYVAHLQLLKVPTVSPRVVEFVAMREKRTARTPLAPVVPTKPPPGFRLGGVKRTKSYAVSWFVATRATTVTTSALESQSGPGAEVLSLST